MTKKPPDSSSLELITEESDTTERRRLPRLNLTHEQFRLTSSGKVFSVVDLSKNGMALRVIDHADIGLLPVATLLDGFLNLRREKHPVQAMVRHLGTEHIGCEFTTMPPETRIAIDRFLDPAALGGELKPIPSNEQQSTLWYHGPSGTDLLLWRGWDGQYHKFSLFVLGSYIQWEAEKGIVTGRTTSSEVREEVRGIMRFETMLMTVDEKVDAGKINVARTLLQASPLPPDLKKWVDRVLVAGIPH